jgi:predicted TIM-barrel fold metal-dependent hydrolase
VNPDDLILISVDDHISEPADMFEAHVPASYRDRMPRVVTDEHGRQKWWYGDSPGRALGLNAVAGKPREMYNIDAARYDEMRAGCWNVHERVRDMSAGGQLAGLNFPNWPGFAGQVLSQGPDRDANLVMIQAYNDWHIDEWCAAYPDRFIPCGLVPLFDAEKAAAEVRRIAAKGCHAVTFSENPTAYDLPSINTDYWDPFFAACADEGTVACLHLGSSGRSVQISLDAPASVPMTLSAATTINTLIELVWADFWFRFPGLKMSLTEGDIGWIPYFLQRAEHILARHSGWTRHRFPDGYTPTEVFLERILVCFIDDPVGVAMIDRFNVDNVCWESDYPHSDSAWPNAPETVATTMAPLTDEQVAKITHENAMRHFQFDPFRSRPRERCTAGALRAEATDVDVVTHVGKPPDDDDLEIFMEHSGFRPARNA